MRALIAIASFLVVNTSLAPTLHAEPILLAELTATAAALLTDSDAPTGGVVGFHVGVDGGAFGPSDNALWEIETTVADLGRTFTATDEFVAAFDAFSKGERSQVSFGVRFSAPGGINARLEPELRWTGIFAGFNNGGVTAEAFVPQLGVGLTGYHVTDIEQIIHRWFAIRSSAQASEFGHTVRIFGEPIPIPEPASIVLLLIGCFARNR